MYKRLILQGDSDSTLASELRDLRASDPASKAANAAGSELIRRMGAMLKTLVGHFSARGTLTEDDILQVGREQVIACVDTYDSRFGAFEPWAYRHAKSAIGRHVRRQSSDVHVSDWCEFDRAGTGDAPPEIQVASRDEQRKTRSGVPDAVELYGDFGRAPERSESAEGTPTPESLFADAEQGARLREALRALTPADRELVRAHFGMGRPQQSLRDIARQRKVSRQQLDKQLKQATTDLRRLLRNVR